MHQQTIKEDKKGEDLTTISEATPPFIATTEASTPPSAIGKTLLLPPLPANNSLKDDSSFDPLSP